jgi:crotonobetainyl-CoA:carnitine CoA-transferase CaiB-like acyl-CoA transferase
VSNQALGGIVVVDLTRHIAGPYCTQMLGDMGADVIKVESLRGDDTRQEEPFYEGSSLYFMNYNRNKRSIALDLRSSEAHEVLDALIARADVLIQNYRPGVMADMGYSWERLRRLNPRLLYVSVSGFGPRGPYADRPAFDEVLQAMSGLMDLTGPADGTPTLVGVPIIDTLTAVYALGATIAGLFHRERTGEAQAIEVNLYGCALSAVNPSLTRFLASGAVDRRNGNRNRYEAGINTYRTLDGYVHLVAYSDAHWQRLARRIGGEALAGDARYATVQRRSQAIDTIDELVATWTAQRSTRDVLDSMVEDGVPCGPVRSITDVASDPELVDAERTVMLRHPNGDQLPFLAMPIEFSATPPGVRTDPPDVGAHTEEVLRQLGIEPDRIEGWLRKGVIGGAIAAAN